MRPENDTVELLKQKYDFKSWSVRNRLAENLFVNNYLLTSRPISDWNILKEEEIKVEGVPRCQRSFWVNPRLGTEASFRLDVYECASLPQAHEFLIRVLATFHSPLVGQRDDLPIGDVIFTPPGEASAAFARANMVFVISRAGRANFSVAELARQLDLDLASKPEDAKSDARAFSLQMSSASGAGGDAALRVALSERRSAEPVCLKFFSSSGEVQAQGESLVYTATGKRPLEITVYAVDRKGQAVRRTLKRRISK